MDDQTQNNNDFSVGFLIKDKDGNIKKVQQNSVDDYSISNQSEEVKEDFVQNTPQLPTPASPTPTPPAQTPQKPAIKIDPAPAIKDQAPLLYDPDEEEEIRKHQEELNKILQTTDDQKNANNYANLPIKIIQELNLTFETEILKKRFEKVIESYLRGIRNGIEIEEVLHRQTKVGGLDFDEELSKKIVNYANEHKKTINQIDKTEEIKKDTTTEPAEIIQAKFTSAPPAFIPMPKANIPDAKEDKAVPQEEKEIEQPDKIEIQEEKNYAASVTANDQAIDELKDNKEVNDLYKKSPAEEMAKMASNRQQAQQRPQVMDIRRPSSIIGPVEELLSLNIKEFRRLGNNPAEAADKILEKIYILEEESWEMRMDGISAWQDSSLYKLYVEIGRESLKNNKVVQEVISDREKEGLPSIHLQEFLAINDLNNKLII